MIAEVFPKTSRAVAAGILQSASGTGFFAAILLEYLVGGNWRYAFFGGALPARAGAGRATGPAGARGVGAGESRRPAGARDRVGSLAAVFAEPELRRRLLLATALAVVGIFGYWGTNFWVNARFTELLRAQGVEPALLASACAAR